VTAKSFEYTVQLQGKDQLTPNVAIYVGKKEKK